MRDMEFTVSDIKDLMKSFGSSGLTSMKLKQSGFSLEMERGEGELPKASAQPAFPDSREAAPTLGGQVVKSPLVGTFYASSAPGGQPYVKAGSMVKKGDVLCIIESMKLMNEVVSEFDGAVSEILAEDGAAVEYGQPILTIE